MIFRGVPVKKITLYNVVIVHIFLYRFQIERNGNYGKSKLYDVNSKQERMGNDQSSAPKEDGEGVPSQVLGYMIRLN